MMSVCFNTLFVLVLEPLPLRLTLWLLQTLQILAQVDSLGFPELHRLIELLRDEDSSMAQIQQLSQVPRDQD
jgi:hypothetical protein